MSLTNLDTMVPVIEAAAPAREGSDLRLQQKSRGTIHELDLLRTSHTAAPKYEQEVCLVLSSTFTDDRILETSDPFLECRSSIEEEAGSTHDG